MSTTDPERESGAADTVDTSDPDAGDVERRRGRRRRRPRPASGPSAALAAPEFSRSHLQQRWPSRGHVRVDAAACTHNARRLRAGQVVEVELVPTAESLAFRPQPMDPQGAARDAHVLVLDKPAGLVVHLAAGNWSGTLLNGLLARHAGAAVFAAGGHRAPAGQGHLGRHGRRQDRLEAVTALVRDIAAREVRRQYLARWPGAR